jgi:guanylate kinase
MPENVNLKRQNKGLLLVLSGPSGSGKGTILRRVVTKNKNVRCSISVTTREPRNNEVEGKNYFFKSKEEFRNMVRADELVEWVEYCGNYYGTPLKYINDSVEKGYDVILEIEVEGAVNIKEKYPNCILVFITPPSFEELRNRLLLRGTEDSGIVDKRLDRAKEEIDYIKVYDYVIVNDVVECAVDDLNCILRAEKLRNK